MSQNHSCDSTLLLLRGFDIFEHITDEEYAELGLVHNYVEATNGEYIYFPHQNRNKLYFAKDGFIKLGYIDDDGKEVIKEIIQKGEVFGQLTLERDNDEDEFAQAYKGHVSLCAFTIEDFVPLHLYLTEGKIPASEELEIFRYFTMDQNDYELTSLLEFEMRKDMYVSNEGGGGAANILIFRYRKL